MKATGARAFPGRWNGESTGFGEAPSRLGQWATPARGNTPYNGSDFGRDAGS